jgi:hypothetical protein
MARGTGKDCTSGTPRSGRASAGADAAFGEALHDLLYTESMFALYPHRDGDWQAGGCWPLAEALCRLTGGELWCVRRARSQQVDHMFCKLGERYLDGGGCYDKRGMLRTARELGVGQPELQPFDPDSYLADEHASIPRSEQTTRRLVAALRRAFAAAGLLNEQAPAVVAEPRYLLADFNTRKQLLADGLAAGAVLVADKERALGQLAGRTLYQDLYEVETTGLAKDASVGPSRLRVLESMLSPRGAAPVKADG